MARFNDGSSWEKFKKRCSEFLGEEDEEDNPDKAALKAEKKIKRVKKRKQNSKTNGGRRSESFKHVRFLGSKRLYVIRGVNPFRYEE